MEKGDSSEVGLSWRPKPNEPTEARGNDMEEEINAICIAKDGLESVCQSMSVEEINEGKKLERGNGLITEG